MAKEIAPNRTYLIRCWHEFSETTLVQVWRFSVEEVLHERSRWGFENLESLIEFLREELEIDSSQPSGSIP